MAIAFVDCETTGLDPWEYQLWEQAVILCDDWNGRKFERVKEHCFQIEQTATAIRLADPVSMEINRFHDRYDENAAMPKKDAAELIARLTNGNVIAAINADFDGGFMGAFLRTYRLKPGWHYRKISVEQVAAGYLMAEYPGMIAQPPWASDDLAIGIGVDPSKFERHTALGDARMAKEMWEVMNRGNAHVLGLSAAA